MDDPSGPDLCHCFALRRGARRMTRLYDRHLAPAQVTISQFTLLSVLNRNAAVEIADLAAMMVMERTTLLRALKPLRQAGWVVNETVSGGRRHVVSLTPAGRDKLSGARSLWEAAQAEFEHAFGRERATRLRGEVQDAVAGGSATTT